MKQHIVIDIETLATSPDARILSVGAVRMGRELEPVVLDSFYLRISAYQQGRCLDKPTLQWWETVSSSGPLGALAHHEAIEHPERMPLETVLHDLNLWLSSGPAQNCPIWGNGSDFDNVILSHAFSQYGLQWPYRRNRCLRTLRGLIRDLFPDHPQHYPRAEHHIHHHALHDAEHEGFELCSLLSLLEPATFPSAESDELSPVFS